jgi:hypothetical protein
MTPTIEGITERTVELPESGLQANTWYTAEVSSSEDNVFHTTLVFTGKDGTVESASIINPTYDCEVSPLSDAFVVRKFDLIGKLKSIKTPELGEMKERAFYVACIQHEDMEPTVGLAYTGFLNGRNGTPGGYSFAYIEGDRAVMEYADVEVTLLHLLMTEDELSGEVEDEEWVDCPL